MPASRTERFGALAALVLDPGFSTRVALTSPWHGPPHWQAVCLLALALADEGVGADLDVTLCFGLLHDTQRHNDDHDPGHGPRAAEEARRLHAAGDLPLTEAQLAVLVDAVGRHDRGGTTDDPTIAACWDADRLTLPRVGIVPDPRYLSTAPARDGRLSGAAAALLAAPPPGFDVVLARYDGR